MPCVNTEANLIQRDSATHYPEEIAAGARLSDELSTGDGRGPSKILKRSIPRERYRQ